MKTRYFLFLLILLVACDKKHDDVTDDGDLWLYANRFYDESAARGFHLDPSELTIRFVDESEISPYSGFGTVDPPLVRIVKTRWENFTPVQKEILMFHEIGHAVLRRQHTNEQLPNCDYKSMMMDGNQFIVYGEQSVKREYYVDELFDPYTPYPSWGGVIGPNKTILVDNTSGAQFVTVAGSSHTGNIEDDGVLHIHGGGTDGIAYWQIPVAPDNIPGSTSVIAKFKVKTTAVTRDGVWIAFQADPSQNKYIATSTNFYRLPITETTVYTEYTLVLNCYPGGQPDLYLNLVMGGKTTGDVWFKDVEVAYYN